MTPDRALAAPGEEPGSHTPPLWRRAGATAAATPGDVPAEAGTSYETYDPRRKVMSPATEICMQCFGRNHEEGIKMRVRKAVVDKVWTLSTRLWPDKRTMSELCLLRRKQPSEEDRQREFGFVTSSPRLLAMNE